MARSTWAGIILVTVAGCSLTFDDGLFDTPLEGEAPSLAGRQRIQIGEEERELAFTLDGHGDPYLVVCREGSRAAVLELCRWAVRVVKLAPPFTEVRFESLEILLTEHGFYSFDDGLYMARDADGTPLSASFAQLVGTSREGEVVVTRRNDSLLLTVLRRDGRYLRTVAPYFVSAGSEYGPYLDRTGRWLFTRSTASILHGFPTDQEGVERQLATVSGQLGSRIIVDNEGQRLVFCDASGVRAVSWAGGASRSIDLVGWCSPWSFYADDRVRGLEVHRGQAVYGTDQDHVQVASLDQDLPPLALPAGGGARLLAIGHRQLLVTRDPPDRWAQQASDGWLGERRVMERGRLPVFSRDGRRLRWLEHAADRDGLGELQSIAVGPDGPGAGPPLRLALNVKQFDELPDGRLLVADHQNGAGSYNRVIVIDEQARTARWVAPAAAGYLLVPGSSDILIRQPLPRGGEELVRVPVPPR